MKPNGHVLKFIVRNDVYPYPVAFWFGPHDEKAMVRWVHRNRLGNRSHLNLLESDVAACFAMHGSSLVWLKKEPDRITEAGTLVHEVAHAAFNCADYLGFKHSTKSEEFYTYLIQYLTTRAMRRLAQLRRVPR